MKDKKDAKSTTKSEMAKEMNAKDISWELFKKTGNTGYYQLFSALKDENKQNKQ